jgi:hypothetical protein
VDPDCRRFFAGVTDDLVASGKRRPTDGTNPHDVHGYQFGGLPKKHLRIEHSSREPWHIPTTQGPGPAVHGLCDPNPGDAWAVLLAPMASQEHKSLDPFSRAERL